MRNERRVNKDLRCKYDGCERLCRSRASFSCFLSLVWEGCAQALCVHCSVARDSLTLRFLASPSALLT